ncbi:MAG: hypothetical protein AB7F40_00895 [Victivallaceae bacterium]|nr:hypothetical protein [Victivallaceae bacterium]
MTEDDPDDLLSGEWDWHIADAQLELKMRAGVRLTPESLVKASAVRSVYHVDDLFLKIEHPDAPLRQLKSRLFPKAETEFETAVMLREAEIPTVDCLGWGTCGSRNMLITREFPGASDVQNYFYEHFVYGNGQYEHFVELLTTFLRGFFRSGFYHDDLHFGNLLYSPEMGAIVLVDLADISREEELSAAQLRRMRRSVIELREGLPEEDMLLAITSCGIAINTAQAREFFFEEVAEAAQRRLDEWPRRRRQILDGYAKFVTPVIEGDKPILLRKNWLQKEVMPPVSWKHPDERRNYEMREYSEKDAEALFLRSLFLQMCRVPHRMVAAWESPGNIYFEPLPELNTKLKSSSAFGFFTETLATQEIVTDVGGIVQTHSGKFMLSDLEEVETLID